MSFSDFCVFCFDYLTGLSIDLSVVLEACLLVLHLPANLGNPVDCYAASSAASIDEDLCTAFLLLFYTNPVPKGSVTN